MNYDQDYVLVSQGANGITFLVGHLVTCRVTTLALASADDADKPCTHVVSEASGGYVKLRESGLNNGFVRMMDGRGTDPTGELFLALDGKATDVRADIVDGGGTPVGDYVILQSIGFEIRIPNYVQPVPQGTVRCSVNIQPGVFLT